MCPIAGARLRWLCGRETISLGWLLEIFFPVALPLSITLPGEAPWSKNSSSHGGFGQVQLELAQDAHRRNGR